jgi:hypothetical protein
MLKRSCCKEHKICNEYVTNIKITDLDEDKFNRFLSNLYMFDKFNCLSEYNSVNGKNIVIPFIMEGSKIFKIYVPWTVKILKIIKVKDYQIISENQKKINNNIDLAIATNSSIVYEICNNNELIYYLINNVGITIFIDLYKNIKNTNFYIRFKGGLSSFIIKNMGCFTNYCSSYLIDFIITCDYNDKLIDCFFPILINNNNISSLIVDLLKKNKNKILVNLLTKYNIEITKEIIEKWCNNSITQQNVNENMEIFFTFNFKLTKEIVIILLAKKFYVKNINKYNIPIDNDIIQTGIKYNSYDYYNIECIPNEKTLELACSIDYKINAEYINFLDKLKNAGGIFDIKCLKLACLNPSRVSIVSYLIKNCGIEPNDECVKTFEEMYNFKPLSLIIKNYNPKPNNVVENINPIIINNDVLTTINKKNIEIDETKDYVIYKKIKILLNLKGDTIKYGELEKLMLKYLIDNNLIIGTYFIIDVKLSSIISIEKSSILHIDELKTFIPYLIKN